MVSINTVDEKAGSPLKRLFKARWRGAWGPALAVQEQRGGALPGAGLPRGGPSERGRLRLLGLIWDFRSCSEKRPGQSLSDTQSPGRSWSCHRTPILPLLPPEPGVTVRRDPALGGGEGPSRSESSHVPLSLLFSLPSCLSAFVKWGE